MTGSTRKPCLVHAPLLTLIVVCQFAISHAGTPVVIWCPQNESSDFDSAHKTTLSNPLLKLSSEDFEENLSKLGVTDPAVIIAEELCVEDLKDNKVLSIATNGSKLHYFPFVFKPAAVFQKVFSDKQVQTIEDINDHHELNMILKDSDPSTCVALTGKQCRYSQAERIKRDTAAEESEEFKINIKRFLFYSSQTPLFHVPGKTKTPVKLALSKMVDATAGENENGTMTVNIKFSGVDDIGDLSLRFFFTNTSVGYYAFTKIAYTINGNVDSLWPRKAIQFPNRFSYHCSLQSTFANNTVSLNMTDVQFQVDPTNGVFGDAYDCVGFTSIPIWTGIFVTAILALIMIWALTMIMDIRTMDRFDDPKGKTITISAAE
ncbi:hypothetical protein DMN91_001543 [Ooceraea biroi]|uniref:V-type proton ATPase subunit S1 n=1 Tax=Ooceraea biroi TaxID=2015173 RepID=A0A026W9I5_OOCBI|nr:uncharacterized protein LOC105281677 [Ooceraea biroi]EZA52705.1 V-type proton ATPase subunit S1 [Ooceraea biroi]RLU25387.1 hypothetical protein DMN91_001543 [Ooceraea biroi]